MADVLHYKRMSLPDIRAGARKAGIAVRRASMKPRVLVVDYGVGNLLSVCRAFEACGADGGARPASPSSIAAAERLVVPGVGAFGDCMDELRAPRADQADPRLHRAAAGRCSASASACR